MTPSSEVVLDHLRWGFSRARSAASHLTDEEFFWEPATPCWSIRPRGDAVKGWGVGRWTCEDVWPPPDPLPVTTIGWRLVHLAAWTDIYRSFAFEDGSASLLNMEVPGTAEGAVGWLVEAQDRFAAAVSTLTVEQLDEHRPAHWGDQIRLSVLVGIIEIEHIHHGAEISLLRDLRRGSATTAEGLLIPADIYGRAVL